MKKELLCIVFLMMILLPMVSAIEITLSKDSYSPFETLQAKITGHFISILPENIFIYKDDVPRANPVVSGFFSIDDAYHYYALLPKTEGNYSLRIENSEYTDAGDLKSDTLVKKFTIKKTNQSNSILSIDPGFIVTSKDFSIKVKSPYKNQLVNIKFDGSGVVKNLSLKEDEEQTISYSIEGVKEGKYVVQIGNYNIPVYIINNPIPIVRKELTFYPNEINAKVTPGSNYFFKMILQNTGDNNITDIKLINNLNAVISPTNITRLNRYEKIYVNITVPVADNIKNNITGVVTVQYAGKSTELDVFLELTKNQTQVNLNGTTITPDISCSSIGKSCVYPEKCIGDTTESLDGPCCLGECKVATPANPASTNWIFGIIALAVLAVIAYFLIKKSRKKPKSAEEILDEKTKKFGDRMSGVDDLEVKDKVQRS